MKRISNTEKLENLTTYLRLLTSDKKFFIHSMNLGNGTVYSITEQQEKGVIYSHSKFYNYDTMLAFLEGMVSMKNGYIKF